MPSNPLVPLPTRSGWLRRTSRALVVCSLESWDDVWRRNQFLVRELLALDPALSVLFVEPPLDVLHVALRRRGWSRPGLSPVAGYSRLWQLRPVKALPRVAGPAADMSLARQVRRAVARLGLVPPTLWINDSTYYRLLGDTSWPALYDITDDWLLAESASSRERARLHRREDLLLRQADAVVVCSRALATSRGRSRDVVLIPNAVDVAEFRRPRPRPDDLPPAPAAVYVGTLHADRLDVDLCVELASRRPDIHVVLIGPSALTREAELRMSDQPNLRLLGARPYSDVPAYLQHADVIVVPHVVSPFTDSLDPIKAYECQAVDTAVVATPAAGFRGLEDGIVVAPRGQFVDAVANAISGPGRRASAHSLPTWRTRAEQFASVLGTLDQSLPRRART